MWLGSFGHNGILWTRSTLNDLVERQLLNHKTIICLYICLYIFVRFKYFSNLDLKVWEVIPKNQIQQGSPGNGNFSVSKNPEIQTFSSLVFPRFYEKYTNWYYVYSINFEFLCMNRDVKWLKTVTWLIMARDINWGWRITGSYLSYINTCG